MPLVQVSVGEHGHLTVLLDREPYCADGVLRRDDVTRVLDEIAAALGTPVRVEVHEADGSTFTDIILPSEQAPTSAPAPADRVRESLGSAFAISGEGFTAGEQVEVCVVVARQIADKDGMARLRLPSALLTAHPSVVLVGRSSGAVALGEGARRNRRGL
jgi:hypothetical protein